MDTVRTVLTYEDYAALPDDTWRYEIHAGELSVTPSPTFRHQLIIARLLGVLRDHVITHGLGEVVPSPITVVLSNTSIVQPDIVYLARDRMRGTWSVTMAASWPTRGSGWAGESARG